MSKLYPDPLVKNHIQWVRIPIKVSPIIWKWSVPMKLFLHQNDLKVKKKLPLIYVEKKCVAFPDPENNLPNHNNNT